MSKNSEDVSTPVKETLFRSPFGRLLLLEENLVFGFLETIEPLVAPLSLPLFARSKLSLPLGIEVGLTGFEPVTLRLSSACSNQLSYRPESFLHGCLRMPSFLPRYSVSPPPSGGMGIRTPDL